MADQHLFAPYIGGPGVRFTDYEAMQRLFQVRDIDFKVERLDRMGSDHRLITLGGPRHAWTFEFDESGRLVRSDSDCY